MALTIKQLMDYSWMSQASYLNLDGLALGNVPDLIGKLKSSDINKSNIFTDHQAKLFTGSATSDPADGFNFINHIPNVDDTGFSATVFQSNEDNTYTIAVRGTEPPGEAANNNFWKRSA